MAAPAVPVPAVLPVPADAAPGAETPAPPAAVSRVPDLVLIDSRWWPEIVYGICREITARGLRCLPSMGFGSTGRRSPFAMPRNKDGGTQTGRDWYLTEAAAGPVGGSAKAWRCKNRRRAWALGRIMRLG